MSVMAIVARSPPPSASTSPTQVSSGRWPQAQDSAVLTSQLTGLKPIDRSASISSDTCIVASSEARPAPERPATTMAVTRGPSSRKCAMTTSSGTYTSAPNRPSCETPRNPMMSPTSRFAALVTGSASAPMPASAVATMTSRPSGGTGRPSGPLRRPDRGSPARRSPSLAGQRPRPRAGRAGPSSASAAAGPLPSARDRARSGGRRSGCAPR